MKCPKCGTEIKDGNLYCEKCGEEIHIVPDFEPEIEYSMRQTLSGIVEDVLEEVPKEQEEKPEDKKRGKRFRITLAVCISCALLLIAVAVTAVVLGYRYHSADYQVAKAKACIALGNNEEAIVYYERAIALDAENMSLRLALADLYSAEGMDEAYVECLRFVIEFLYTPERELDAAYKKLIAFYVKNEDYAAINELLVNTENETIKTAFQSYMAAPPEFSYTEGTYAEVVPLKLTASTQGTIYYTLDGTIPDESSEIYTTPIFLETGSYKISAIFVNEYGIKSEVVTKSYVIDVLKPAAPEVETYSGEYTVPTMISVSVPPGANVYYTTDGSVPTYQSTPYISPIPMPLGKSTFKFVTYNKEGVAGDCTTRQFELTLATEFTPELAVTKLVETMVAIGRIQDDAGTVTGEISGRYLYMFQYALAIPDAGDFYVISEVYEDLAGIQNKTGTTYAVNVYTQECYKLSRGALDDYILETF